MATIHCNDNWVQFNSCFEDEEEEEALSLCDLPTNDQETEPNSNKKEDEYTPEFEFGSTGNVSGAAHSPENMCNADEVFFQGRIKPFTSAAGEFGRKINRSTSASMVNDRSTRPDPKPCRYNKPKTRNQFHSHPSPSPQIRTQSFRTLSHSSNSKTSSLWSFLQVGLLKPQEIGLSDLKNRSKRFGSHNSNSSSTSSSTMNSMNSTTTTIEQNHHQIGGKNTPRKSTKKKQRLLFSSGCKCSVDSIESTRKDSCMATKKKNTNTTKEENERTVMIGDGKRAVSRHRTFEWLKQLSIAAPSEA